MIKKILLLIGIVSLLFGIWFLFLEDFYATVLFKLTNAFLSINSDLAAELKTENGHPVILVGSYTNGAMKQQLEMVSLPIIILIAWQVFLVFSVKLKAALKAMLLNFSVFLVLQSIFLSLLLGYNRSDIATVLYNSMHHGFGIIALFLILKDNLTHQVFSYPK